MTTRRGSVRLSIEVPAELSQLRLLTGVVRRCLVDGAGIYPSDAAYHQIQLAIREACSKPFLKLVVSLYGPIAAARSESVPPKRRAWQNTVELYGRWAESE